MKRSDIIKDFIAPPRCEWCDELMSIEYNLPLCQKCYLLYEKCKHELCEICGKEHCLCECEPTIYGHSKINAYAHLCSYKASVPRRMILDFKNMNNRRIRTFFGAELSELIRNRFPKFRKAPIVTYVPRSKRSARLYGHDQSRVMAIEIANNLGYEYVPLFTNAGNKKQKTLDKFGRIDNALNNYTENCKYTDKIHGRNVIIVDDVITTGASIIACASILKEYGAASVYAVSVAKV